MSSQVPFLYVEGKDDFSVVSNLLNRHGVDTQRGSRHLQIKDLGDIDSVLGVMCETIKLSSDRPVGFVIDIDIEAHARWGAVCERIRKTGVAMPSECPPGGYLGQLPDYPFKFGVWMMMDCTTDYSKMEHLAQTLIGADDPLWPYAMTCVKESARIVDSRNETAADESLHYRRYREVDTIKAEMHTWLAWQARPGVQLGAAIQDRILSHDSPAATSFVDWLKQLYSFAVTTPRMASH
jgi:hypothetical protein